MHEDKGLGLLKSQLYYPAQKMKFSIKDFSSKCDQIIFCAVLIACCRKISFATKNSPRNEAFSILVSGLLQKGKKHKIVTDGWKMTFLYSYFLLNNFGKPVISISHSQEYRLGWLKRCCFKYNNSNIKDSLGK